MLLDPETVHRFWAKVQKTEDPNECWLWKAAARKGYGAFKVGRRVFDAHRVSWMIHHPGDEPEVVCHNCPTGDNPLCVNPTHLFAGTVADNNRDMVAKGRHWHGPNWKPGYEEALQRYSTEGSKTKLTEEDARVIRGMAEMGYHPDDLAEKFGVARRTIYDVLKGRTW